MKIVKKSDKVKVESERVIKLEGVAPQTLFAITPVWQTTKGNDLFFIAISTGALTQLKEKPQMWFLFRMKNPFVKKRQFTSRLRLLFHFDIRCRPSCRHIRLAPSCTRLHQSIHILRIRNSYTIWVPFAFLFLLISLKFYEFFNKFIYLIILIIFPFDKKHEFIHIIISNILNCA